MNSLRLSFFAAAFSVLCLVASPRMHAADDAAPSVADSAWTHLAADPSDPAWREGQHRGWFAAGDAQLDAANADRLSGDGDPGASGDGALLSRGDSDLYTRDEFGDCVVKLEFMIPRGANSGVKLNGHYEIQIRDTHGKPVDQLTGDDCGGIYPRGENRPQYHQIDKGVAPKLNAAKPAGDWQTLEITFRAPRFDVAGKKTENARFLRVVHNGEVIHEDVELLHPTGAAWDEQTEIPRGPFQLQGDHGPVAFRHIAIRPLSEP